MHCPWTTTCHTIINDPLLLGAFVATGLFGLLIGLMISKLASGGGGRRRRERRGASGDGSCVEIYVGNLSYDMTEAHMRKEFERYGVVKSSRIITNRFNSKSKGYGFIEMPNRPEAEAAIKGLHDRDILGRKLRVNEAKNKSHE